MLLHQKAPDGNGKLARGMAPHLPPPSDFQEWHYLTQLNQSRAVVFGIEHFRALAPLCMGAIVWQLNDCWPVTSWAAVDGDGRRKPIWHGLRRANDPRLLSVQPSARGGLELVAVNDDDEPWRVEVVVSRRQLTGATLAERTVVLEAPGPGRASVDLAELGTPVEASGEYLVALASGRRPVVHAFVADRELRLSPVEVSLTVGKWSGGEQDIVLSAGAFVRGVTVFVDRVLPEAWVDDSDLDLLPGVPARLRLHAPRSISADELRAPGVLHSLNALVADADRVQAGTNLSI